MSNSPWAGAYSPRSHVSPIEGSRYVDQARHPVSILLAITALGCGEKSVRPPTSEVVVDTIGDTIQVHTAAGSVWSAPRTLTPEATIGTLDGEEHFMFGRIVAVAVSDDGSIHVTDQLAKTVRVYGPEGEYLRSLGTEGGGPGELAGPDGGLAVLSDGRVLVRDPGNQRIQVFAPSGGPIETWRLPTGLSTSDPLYVDDADNVWSPTVLDLGVPLAEWEHGFLRFNASGDSLATDPLPVPDYEGAFVEARREGSWSRTRVPFSPAQEVRVNPTGEYVHAVSDRYAFDVLRADGGVLRIGRAPESVPVSRAESDAARRRIERNFRQMIPDWTWNGPEVPSEKPPYRSLFVALDGRYWVLVSQRAVETDEPVWEPEPGEPAPPRRWVEPVAFDVFEVDGFYLGRVYAPEGFQVAPTPVFRGEQVWAVVEDELGVERVGRFTAVEGPPSS